MAVVRFALVFAALLVSAAAKSVTVTDHVFFDMSIGGEPVGRMLFALFGEQVPNTAKNFKHLALHTEGYGYKGSIFHRIIPGFMAQGGDFENRDGTGGKSIYGAKFDDENFHLKHVGRGILSMANAGPNTNGAQFFITFKDTPWLNGRHVVFGKLISGGEVLDQLERLSTGAQDRPNKEVTVSDCGSIDVDSAYKLDV